MKKETLMTRDEFRTKVFEKYNHVCIFCKKPAVDAHHIIDRKAFKDGGYYLDNGVAVCEDCHWKCEKSEITPDEIRKRAGITVVVLPEGLDPSREYDKWGKEI